MGGETIGARGNSDDGVRDSCLSGLYSAGSDSQSTSESSEHKKGKTNGESGTGAHIKDFLKKYDLVDCASVKCPMLPPNNLGPDESGVSVNETQFKGMIGYQANSKESHFVVMKRIFRYLKGTSNLGLWYPKGLGFDLKAYLDSDYAGCNLDRKSTSGGCQILRGKLVCWSVKKQTFVAMSLAEAEYVPTAGCCAQVLWVKSQLADYDVLYDKVPILWDNTSAITISNNPVLHSRIKTY
ncbi:hypothetical protein Tco_0366440 [Tanacetum coccineum]